MSSLKKKTISGLIWTFSQQFGVQAINFVVSIVLARILLPEEFGLIGMIAVFIAIGRALVSSGMGSSLIRTKDPDKEDYSTVFYANLMLSIVVYFIVFILAPSVAIFFNQEILDPLLKVYCLSFIINAFSIVQSTKLNKVMDFKTQLIINIPSLLVAGILGIYLAYSGYGVWSLVWMQLTQIFLATIQLWLFSKWLPSLVFNKNKFLKHFNFGYKLTLSGILNSTINNLYNIVIGKFFPPAQLGFFTRAKSMQDLPVSNLTLALNKVTYPMFATIKNDDIQLKNVYTKLMQQIFFWIVPILIIAIIIAAPLFNVLLTSKWLPAVPYFQILCLAGLVKPLSMYNLNILLIKGKSGTHFKLEAFKNALIIFSAFLVFPFGIYGMLVGFVIASYITFFVNASVCGQIINYSLKEQLKNILPILLIGLPIGIIGMFSKDIISSYLNNDLLILTVTSVLLMILYFSLARIFKLSVLTEFFKLINSSTK